MKKKTALIIIFSFMIFSISRLGWLPFSILVNNNCNCFPKDESSEVFGTPKVALEKGGVTQVLSLDNISSEIMKFFE